jgi:hypothetical protein
MNQRQIESTDAPAAAHGRGFFMHGGQVMKTRPMTVGDLLDCLQDYLADGAIAREYVLGTCAHGPESGRDLDCLYVTQFVVGRYGLNAFILAGEAGGGSGG